MTEELRNAAREMLDQIDRTRRGQTIYEDGMFNKAYKDLRRFVPIELGCESIGCVFYPDRNSGAKSNCNCLTRTLTIDEQNFIRNKIRP